MGLLDKFKAKKEVKKIETPGFRTDSLPTPSTERLLLYILTIKYEKQHGREITYNLNQNQDLYPFGWFSINDEMKIKMLEEAIEKRQKIGETTAYISQIEGIR